MPNKTIYLDTIKEMEEDVGFSLINKEEMEKLLKDAWKQDTTQEKSSFLGTYRQIFDKVLKTYCEHELSTAFYMCSEKKPDFKKCLLKTDETLKLSAMALIPELRENEDVLSNMTFGWMDSSRLKIELMKVSRAYSGIKSSSDMMKKRRVAAYAKYQEEWRTKSSHKIAALVNDQAALSVMSEDEKIDYALALEAYRMDENLPYPLGERAKEVIDEALSLWKETLEFDKAISVSESVAGRYFQYSGKLAENDWIQEAINAAVAEFNSVPNPANAEIAKYKEIEEINKELKQKGERLSHAEITEEAAEAFGEFFTEAEETRKNEEIAFKRKKTKEHTILNKGVTEETAEIVGAFFMQEELTVELADRKEDAKKEGPHRKEREFLSERITEFNQKYSLRVSNEKLRTSVEQVSALMIAAREEKEQFLSKDNVIVIENGETKCYSAKEYYKDIVDAANKEYEEKKSRIETQRVDAKKAYEKQLQTILLEAKDDMAQTPEGIQKLKEAAEKVLNIQLAGFDKELAEAKHDLEIGLSTVQGGVVFEKNGDDLKRYKASQYYETHETKKEQYAYGEYQKMYSRVYKDACKNMMEQNYLQGKVTDFAAIAKDVDDMFKSAMYISNVYENDKNIEVIQKSNFGGFSAEQLATFVREQEEGTWALNQSSTEAWAKQTSQAKRIASQWREEEKNNPKVKPADRIKATLAEKRASFAKGEITRKEMLDYMIAADSHLKNTFSTRGQRVFSLIQYRREKNALKECFASLGMKETDSLRVAMNEEYTKMAAKMSKEEIFKSVGEKMNSSLNFKEEKAKLSTEHQIVQDRLVAEKMAKLEELKRKDREPCPITELDERKAILNQGQLVPPIVPPAQTQRKLSIKQ